MQASILSGCRNDTALRGGWDARSSALGLQTQQEVDCCLTLSLSPSFSSHLESIKVRSTVPPQNFLNSSLPLRGTT
jgi:hypothetical protein